MSNHKQTLLTKINEGKALIGIIGLGYVGLPLALAYAEKGFSVLGFDVDAAKVKALDRGECYISHIDGTRIKKAVRAGKP